MAPSPPFASERLILRTHDLSDVPALRAHLNHPRLLGCRYIPWEFTETLPLSARQVERIVNKWLDAERSLHLALEMHGGGEWVGHAACDWAWDALCPSVAVVIAPERQRQGLGSEALACLLGYLFEYTPAHTVSCWIADWNDAGRAFARRHGFQENGRMRRAGIRQGRYFDMIIADVLRPEWRHQAGGASHAA